MRGRATCTTTCGRIRDAGRVRSTGVAAGRGRRTFRAHAGVVRWRRDAAGIGRDSPSTAAGALRWAATGGRCAARNLVLATGAYDLQVPFPGWDLPGVTHRRRRAVAAQGTRCGRRAPGGRWPAPGRSCCRWPRAWPAGARRWSGCTRRRPPAMAARARSRRRRGRQAGRGRRLRQRAGPAPGAVPHRWTVVAAHGADGLACDGRAVDRLAAGDGPAAADHRGRRPGGRLGVRPPAGTAVGAGLRHDRRPGRSAVAPGRRRQRTSVPGGSRAAGEASGVGGAELAVVEGELADRRRRVVGAAGATGARSASRRPPGSPGSAGCCAVAGRSPTSRRPASGLPGADWPGCAAYRTTPSSAAARRSPSARSGGWSSRRRHRRPDRQAAGPARYGLVSGPDVRLRHAASGDAAARDVGPATIGRAGAAVGSPYPLGAWPRRSPGRPIGRTVRCNIALRAAVAGSTSHADHGAALDRSRRPMSTKPWHGVLVATALPFRDDLSVDFDALRRARPLARRGRLRRRRPQRLARRVPDADRRGAGRGRRAPRSRPRRPASP